MGDFDFSSSPPPLVRRKALPINGQNRRMCPNSLRCTWCGFRFIRYIYGRTAILAAYSIADLFFGWLGFFSSGSLSAQEVLAFLWITHCLLLLALATRLVFVAPARLSEEEPLIRRTFLLLYLPLLLLTLVMLPTPIGLELNGLACFTVGLQFLCWSHLELSARAGATRISGHSS